MRTRYSHDKHNWYELAAWAKSSYVCGIDEVGRGCLAGPVVVTACILPRNADTRLLRDSKLLSSAQRNKAYEWITQHAWTASCSASNFVIDRDNIYQTTLSLMKKAFFHVMHASGLHPIQVPFVVVDAMPLHLDSYKNYHSSSVASFIKGETHSSSIAAASIVAKVTRDALIEKYARLHPSYGMDIHKGYATRIHREALGAHGLSIAHRTTFCKKNAEKDHETHTQQSLF